MLLFSDSDSDKNHSFYLIICTISHRIQNLMGRTASNKTRQPTIRTDNTLTASDPDWIEWGTRRPDRASDRWLAVRLDQVEQVRELCISVASCRTGLNMVYVFQVITLPSWLVSWRVRNSGGCTCHGTRQPAISPDCNNRHIRDRVPPIM